jgi:IMP dehydrogenase
MQRALTFDDVALVPRCNNVSSRQEPDLTTWMTKGLKVGIPIINSSMDTVINVKLAKVLYGFNSIPIFHRFYKDREDLIKVLDEVESMVCFISTGISTGDDLRYKVDRLASLLGPRRNIAGICIDVAHGHSHDMMDMVKALKDRMPERKIIAGAVCTKEAYWDLCGAGADAIRVGIGPGSACTTRLVTGFGVPQFTALQECGVVAQERRVPMMADGGIRSSGDIVKALAAGASTVLLGRLLASTQESAAEKRQVAGTTVLDDGFVWEAKYRGQASEDFQRDYYGHVKDGTVPEGIDTWIPVMGTAAQVLNELLAGIRSGFTYAGSRHIEELRRKAKFVEVTPNYLKESNPR